LNSAGLAVQALTNSKSSALSTSDAGTLESRKTAFKEATSQYFALLSSVDVRLRRQVYALEEAEFLAPESSSRTGEPSGASAAGSSSSANALDISWLNSRKDTVGKEKEAEVWASTRELITKIQGESLLGSSTLDRDG
jgi:hypothetical protein